MTQLYLIRHGIAEERGESIPDADRSLTENGREKTSKVAKYLADLGIHFEIILTSPLVRARQTTEILQQVGLSQNTEVFLPLAPGGDIGLWINWWSNSRYNREESSLALVGHQPDLGDWAETLVWGSSQEKLIVKKAGIIGLTLPPTKTPIGEGELFVLNSPKWMLLNP